MNIYANKGDKVIYANPENGMTNDQERCKKHLVENQVYTIERTEVDHSHTDVYLQEFPDIRFNSVMFEDDPTAPLNPPDPGEFKVTRLVNLVGRSGSKTVDGQLVETAHPNILIGTIYQGALLKGEPKVGERIIMGVNAVNGKRAKYSESFFSSTPIVKIEGNLYYTKNSVYEIVKNEN